MNLVQLSLRNIFRQKRRSLMLTGAIAFSALIISFLNFFTGGLEESVKNNYTIKNQGHIYIEGTVVDEEGTFVKKISHEEKLLEGIKKSGIEVETIARKSSFTASVIGNSRQVIQEVVGVDLQEGKGGFARKLNLKEGEIAGPGSILLSESLVHKIDAETGEKITLSMKTATGQVNVEDFILSGILKDENAGEYFAYTDISDANRLLNLKEGEYQSLNIYIEELENLNRETEKLSETLKKSVTLTTSADRIKVAKEKGGMLSGGPSDLSKKEGGRENVSEENSSQPSQAMKNRGSRGGMGRGGMFMKNRKDPSRAGEESYTLSTLEDRLGGALEVVDLLGYINAAVFLVLVIITMVGISNTFRMVVLERTGEIGTIRAVGMKRKKLLGLFLLEACITALIGILGGVLINMVIMIVMSLVPLNLPEYQDFLTKGYLKFSPEMGTWLISLGLLVLFSTLAALRAAYRGAWMRPVDALRHE